VCSALPVEQACRMTGVCSLCTKLLAAMHECVLSMPGWSHPWLHLWLCCSSGVRFLCIQKQCTVCLRLPTLPSALCIMGHSSSICCLWG
jgi:hypothetical protein